MSRFTVLRKICNDIELDVHKSLILLTIIFYLTTLFTLTPAATLKQTVPYMKIQRAKQDISRRPTLLFKV